MSTMTTTSFPPALLRAAPAAELVYSSLAFHARPPRFELPGIWLVQALGSIGAAPSAVRQALFRMEREGHLASRREGKLKWYRLTASGTAQIEAGRERLRRRSAPEWDGGWTLVSASFPGGRRRQRLQLGAVLDARGYGRLHEGIRIHPHDDPAALRKLVRSIGLAAEVHIFRGRLAGDDDRALVAGAFPLRPIAAGYTRFVTRFGSLAGTVQSDDRAWFALRLVVAHHYLGAAWDDPGLPLATLPAKWPASRAQRLADRLYRRASDPARRYAASIARRLELQWPAQ